jgi:hypothetical protein
LFYAFRVAAERQHKTTALKKDLEFPKPVHDLNSIADRHGIINVLVEDNTNPRLLPRRHDKEHAAI